MPALSSILNNYFPSQCFPWGICGCQSYIPSVLNLPVKTHWGFKISSQQICFIFLWSYEQLFSSVSLSRMLAVIYSGLRPTWLLESGITSSLSVHTVSGFMCYRITFAFCPLGEGFKVPTNMLGSFCCSSWWASKL